MDAINKFYIENDEIKEVSNWDEEKERKTIYEVLKIMNGKPLFFEEHYKRMLNTCKLINVELSLTENKIRELISELAKANNTLDGIVKITYVLEDREVRVYFIDQPIPSKEMYRDGVETILYSAERENPNAKIINNNLRETVNMKLKQVNAYEAILVDRNGYITEGSRSNIFYVIDEVIYTSKVEAVLPGVTRTEILNAAKENNIKIVEKNLKSEELKNVDALFLTSTAPDILPINKVDNVEFDVNNKALRKLMSIFNEKIEKYIK